MKSIEIQNGDRTTDSRSVADSKRSTIDSRTRKHRGQFIAARDSRNRRIPGLYVRGGRYYAQLWVDLGNGKKAPRRFPLRDGDNQPVPTVSAAREALEIKRHERRENHLPIPGRKP